MSFLIQNIVLQTIIRKRLEILHDNHIDNVASYIID